MNDIGSGTGFFVSNEEKKKIYLVTNKHVIHYENDKRNSIRDVKLVLNVVDRDGIIKRDEISFIFNENSYREHPDNDTDIYALDVTLMFLEFLSLE
jgi:hypothetical protein